MHWILALDGNLAWGSPYFGFNMCFGRVPLIGSEGCGCNYRVEDRTTWKMGMLLPDETYEERSSSSRRSSYPSGISVEIDEVEAAKALAAFRKCDEFLKRHGIRPEFFCRHREKLALQTWLLQRSTSKFNSGESYIHSYCILIITHPELRFLMFSFLAFCSRSDLQRWGSLYKEKVKEIFFKS